MTRMFPPNDVYERGLCISMPSEIWWEPGEGRGRSGGRRPDRTVIHIANAKALCEQCPALEPCRAWALSLLDTSDPLVGVVIGGLDTEDRKRIANDSKPIAHGTARGHRQHAHRGEKPCTPCRIAHNDYARQINALKRERKAS